MLILSRIAVYPIKALDPVNLDRVSITTVGGLAGDRVYGIVDKHGEYVHGKRTAEVNRLETTFDLEGNYLELGVRGTDKVEKFNRERLEAWLSEYFGIAVRLEVKRGGAQTDSAVYTEAEETGPTIISRATLREVASWYDGIDPAEMCLRLRPNLVIGGVPPFWEDRLVANGGWQFVIGDVTLKGVLSVPRCVVPTRDPDTGEVYEGFTETFVEKREETLPTWADRATFDGNFFSLMVVAQILEVERDGELRTGDIVELADSATE